MLKIDLYNNHEQFIKETKQNRAIDSFCRRHKISRTKLEQHPHIEDVKTLMDFDRHAIWFTAKDTQIWTHCWQSVYHNEYTLTKYQKNKLLSIIDGIEYRRQQYNKRVEKRKHIQARLQKKQNKLAAV